MAPKTYLEAVREAHFEVLRDIPEAFVMGQDVQTSTKGTTIGLVDEFGPERVRNTPISEQGFIGLGVGAAMDGKRPIVEYGINTLIHLGFEQLVNQAGKIRYMSNGQFSVPLTVTIPQGGILGGAGAQHGDMTHAPLSHFGVKTVLPSTPYDAKGLFRSAVLEDDPVVVFLPVALHGNRGEVPDEAYSIPLGEADIKRAGEELTIVALGETVEPSLRVAEDVSDRVDVEVIDPRTVVPLDERTIVESVRKTGRVVVVDDATRTCGVATDIAGRLSNQAFWHLEAPIKTVTRPDTPVSYTPPEEGRMTPDEEAIAQAVEDTT